MAVVFLYSGWLNADRQDLLTIFLFQIMPSFTRLETAFSLKSLYLEGPCLTHAFDNKKASKSIWLLQKPEIHIA